MIIGLFLGKRITMQTARVFTMILSFLFCLTCLAQNADSVRAIALLRAFSDKLRSSPYISYHSRERYVNSAEDDSVFLAEGVIWMSGKPSDTIFGQVFHINGRNKNGAFDYYYDGQRSVEVQHDSKEVLLIDPYSSPNNENNPAKARTAMQVYHQLWAEKDLIGYLITDNPYADDPKIRLDSSAHQWIIRLEYPVNSYNASIAMNLVIQKESGWLVETKRVTHWNGTVHTQSYILDRITTDHTIADSIPLTNSYVGYKRKEYRRPAANVATVPAMVGKLAPGFRYAGFDGKLVGLEDMRGKYVLLDFWETWCGYCILALPKMKEVYEKYHSKGLELVGITTENEKRIGEIIQKNQLPYINLKGDNRILKDYLVEARPGYVLIDREGRIVAYNDWEKIEKILEGL
jgi:peroxiredoxin